MSFLRRIKEWWSRPTHRIVRIPRERGQVVVAPTGGPILISATSEGDEKVIRRLPSQMKIHEALGVKATYIDGHSVALVTTLRSAGVKYPDDFSDYPDYYEAYHRVPFVARAVDIKNHYVWQAGYDLEGDEREVERANEALAAINADWVIREGCRWALVFGNFYWRVEEGDPPKLIPLNPMNMGVKIDESTGEITQYVYKRTPTASTQTFDPQEILHLKILDEPWSPFGYGMLRRVIITLRQLLYMEKYLPEIARKRADPWLHFTIKDPLTGQPYKEAEFNRMKDAILNRKPGEDLIDDGSITVEEIYQSAGVAARQTLEGLLRHFRENLVAGLGVPEIYLGFGSTTLKGTAEHQEVGFEAEVRAVQRALKRFHEQQLWPVLGISPDVKLVWRPLKPEDKAALSKQLMEEIEHGVVTPEFARQRLGYPPLGSEEGDMKGSLLLDSRLTVWRISDEKAEG